MDDGPFHPAVFPLHSLCRFVPPCMRSPSIGLTLEIPRRLHHLKTHCPGRAHVQRSKLSHTFIFTYQSGNWAVIIVVWQVHQISSCARKLLPKRAYRITYIAVVKLGLPDQTLFHIYPLTLSSRPSTVPSISLIHHVGRGLVLRLGPVEGCQTSLFVQKAPFQFYHCSLYVTRLSLILLFPLLSLQWFTQIFN